MKWPTKEVFSSTLRRLYYTSLKCLKLICIPGSFRPQESKICFSWQGAWLLRDLPYVHRIRHGLMPMTILFRLGSEKSFLSIRYLLPSPLDKTTLDLADWLPWELKGISENRKKGFGWIFLFFFWDIGVHCHSLINNGNQQCLDFSGI